MFLIVGRDRMQRYSYILPLIVLIPSFAQASQNEMAQKLRKQVQEATAMRMFQTLEGAKVVAFSKDYLIKGGLEDKDLKSWNDVTTYGNEFVLKEVDNKNSPFAYKGAVKQLQEGYAFLKDTVNALNGLV